MGAAEDRRGRVCFTGHRPEKLNADEETIKPLLEREIRPADHRALIDAAIADMGEIGDANDGHQ